jgi:hypothetical protein
MDITAELLLRDAERNRFYGTIEFKYENGKIVLFRKTETLKPSGRDTRDEVTR